ncbi:TerD family protein [Cytophagaceae bacterium DM2B3-1]|uniref:TerD family protein n=1 Tax=Xanthocytophaga flava TaxID=3048013 RepID=A0AAE3QS31_9BACT|nr:TerD family protein [Xanthocytophaga flavus]MDJ1483906.1 TerD family protein [Xanthocytophaga flavus]MDJ1493982.1 TerD family protein [Xanthocytophaga flavus]
MSINLKKGGSINLTKQMPKLNKVMVGLGWEMSSYTLDLDASVFILGATNRLISDEYFVFYNNLKSPDGSVQHLGDNRSGSADDDDEVILVNLENINPAAEDLVICVSIHDAIARRHNYGLLKDAYIRIVDVDNQKEIARYDLDASHTGENAVVFGRIRKSGGEWHFHAASQGTQNELQGLVDMFA